MAPFTYVCCLSMHVSKTPGADPEIEEGRGGGTHRVGGGAAMWHAQCTQLFSAYNAQCFLILAIF